MNPLFSCLLAGLYKMSTDVEVAFFPFPSHALHGSTKLCLRFSVFLGVFKPYKPTTKRRTIYIASYTQGKPRRVVSRKKYALKNLDASHYVLWASSFKSMKFFHLKCLHCPNNLTICHPHTPRISTILYYTLSKPNYFQEIFAFSITNNCTAFLPFQTKVKDLCC